MPRIPNIDFPSIDHDLLEPHRAFIICACLAGGGRAMFADIARRRDVFHTPASLTVHNGILVDAGLIQIEKHGQRHRANTWMVLTDFGDRKARAHLAALRDVMEAAG